MKSINIKSAFGSILRSTLYVDGVIHDNFGYAFICETDGLHTAVEFHKKAKKKGLIPVIGVEIRTLEGFNIQVFARNLDGYRELVKLVTASEYSEELGLQHSADVSKYKWLLVCCKHGDRDRVTVGEDAVNVCMTSLNTIPVVIDPDKENQAYDYKILTALRFNTTVEQVDMTTMHFSGMVDDGLSTPDWKVYFEAYDLPRSSVPIPPSDITEEEFSSDLHSKLTQYLNSMGLMGDYDSDEEYRERLEYELKVINGFGYKDYFVMVGDIIRQCNDVLSGYYSAGRGSVGGSLVAFLMGITRVDPVNPPGFDMGIPFDRFLNSGRKTLPDIDIDFCPRDRAYVIEYLRFKYGVDRVMNIGTTNTLGSRSALREVARVLDLLSPDIEQILRSFPKDQHLTLELVEKSDVYKSNQYNLHFIRLFEIAKRLEGLPRSRGVHASGIAVSTRDFIEFVPMTKAGRGEVLQYDNDSLEAVGVVKFDILGLNMLQCMSDAMRKIGVGVPELMQIPLDDQDTYELINFGARNGIFQWDTHNYKKVIDSLRPSTFKELVDLNTLGRSASLLSGLTDSYIRRKNGEEPIEPIHPSLRGLMVQTYELPLYQEQIMQLFVSLADFTMSEADDVRKAIGKKIPELMEQQKAKFAERCIKKGLSQEEVDGIWEKIDKFSKYTWNLGHAVSYTRVCYETAYLACHFPKEYYSACASNAKDADEAYAFVNVMRQRGVPVLSADINLSKEDMDILPEGVRLGLGGIKSIGDSAVNHIFAVRDGGKFSSIHNFYLRCKGRSVTTRTMKALYCAGAFDSMPDLENFHKIVPMDEVEAKFLRLNQYANSARIAMDTKAFFPDASHLSSMSKFGGIGIAYVTNIKEIYTRAKKELMAFLKIEDTSGAYEAVTFPSVWAKAKSLKEGDVVKVIASPDDKGGFIVQYIAGLTKDDLGKALI